MSNILNKPKKILTRFLQFIYLTIGNFNANNLWESASSCSFGFVFSFIPISMIILAVLTSIIRISPEIEHYILNYAAQFYSIVDIELVLSNITKLQTIHVFDILLYAWIIWMSRKFFSSVISALNRIFRSISKRKITLNQLLMFISEFVLVTLIIIAMLFSFTLSKALKLDFFQTASEKFPRLFSQMSQNLFSSFIYVLLFFLVLFAYKYGSGTKPAWKTCIFYSLLNTITAYFLSDFLNHFLKISNYNIIYGTISTVILLMLKVYFFFVVFLFIAQMIYVSQFYRTLLLYELYMLPKIKKHTFFGKLHFLMFYSSAPVFPAESIKFYDGGTIIYKPDDFSENVYYICQGFVSITHGEKASLFSAGNFFGEKDCILNQNRQNNAKAVTACRILEIPKKDFFTFINSYPKAAKKAMQTLKSEF